MKVDGKDFAWLMSVAKVVESWVMLKGEDRLEFTQTTTANDALVHASIPAEGKLVAPVYTEKLYRGVAKASGATTLSVEGNLLFVEWEGGKYSTELAPHMKSKKLPEINYPAEYAVDTKELITAVNSISKFFSTATFVAGDDCMKVKAEGEDLKVEAALGEPVRAENVAATFKLVDTYGIGLKDVLRAFRGIKEVRVYFGLDSPIQIEGEGNGRKIVAIFAPVMR